MAYIYKITNKINNKSYIGKTEYANPETRWKQHIAESKKERFSYRALYAAMRKYSVENFDFSIIEETDDPCEREQYYIQLYDTYHNGYNETLGGDGKAYLELPEQEIIQYYLNHNLVTTAKHFGHDVETINKVLYKNNIQKHSASQAVCNVSSYPVAQIDKVTNEIIQIFPSVAAAEKATGNNKHIADVVNGKRKTAQGYRWEKIEK